MVTNIQTIHQFQNWKTRVSQNLSSEAEFEKWLFVHSASVLLARKAGELLTLPEKQFGLHRMRHIEILETLTAQWGISFFVLYTNTISTKIIIYQPDRVKACLAEIPQHVLTGALRYQHNMDVMDVQEFLQEIRHRWYETGAIPHEIGFALGYPVKDVLGYMGLLPLECTGVCGWKIYGDPSPSLQIGNEVLLATTQAISFLAA